MLINLPKNLLGSHRRRQDPLCATGVLEAENIAGADAEIGEKLVDGVGVVLRIDAEGIAELVEEAG